MMAWYSVVPPLLRQSWPMFVGCLIGIGGANPNMYTRSVASELAKSKGWGQGEFSGALANMRALVSSVVPLVLARIYSWSTQNGRNWPGAAYQAVAVFNLLTEIVFRTVDV